MPSDLKTKVSKLNLLKPYWNILFCVKEGMVYRSLNMMHIFTKMHSLRLYNNNNNNTMMNNI